jgi:hypothetical protein
LRQEVLEGLAWRFYRIWSTDWFRRRQAEIERLKMALCEAKQLRHLSSRPEISPEISLASAGTAIRIDAPTAAVH